MVDTSDEWITKRTGISQRRIIEDDEYIFEMGLKAAEKAIKDAGITAEDLDMILVTTITPDYLTPSMACMIQGKLGATKASAMDLNAACTGFVYGLTTAQQFILTGYCKYVLIVSCEALSKATDWEDRNTCVLFGDGAGAVVVGAVEEEYGILGTYISADGAMGDAITQPCYRLDSKERERRVTKDKNSIWMDGAEVFKFAVKIMEQATRKVLEDTGTPIENVSMIFPHQANVRIVDGALKRLGMAQDKMYNILGKYGNISSASIPVALDEAFKAGQIKKGDHIVLVGFGGGLTWGSALVRWSK